MSLLKWIFGLLRRQFHWIITFFQWMREIFSSVLAWVVAGIIFVVHEIIGWIGDFWYDMFQSLEDFALGGLPVQPLADWLARDVLALDVAWECLAIGVVSWFAFKVARLSIAVVRVIIDLL